MSTQALLELALGNLGALVILCVAIVAVWRGWFVPDRAYKRETDRNDRLDAISLTAVKTTEGLVELQHTALRNHAKIIDNQLEMLRITREIRQEQEYISREIRRDQGSER